MFGKLTIEEKVYRAVCISIVIGVCILTLYPFIYVASCSISNPLAVLQNKITLIPVGFSLKAYERILSYEKIRIGYMNTIFYATVGTAFSMLLTVLTAYPLSKKRCFGKSFFLFMITFTMLFSGGLIPTYMVVRNLGLVDTRWAIIIPYAINTFNLILMKTFFQNVPVEMEEAAVIDGCGDIKVLFKIFLPLSVPAIATISLYYAVSQWNGFFHAMIYLNSEKLYPVQIFLRNIVINSQSADITDSRMGGDELILGAAIKYATIMVVAVPIILVYPFIQKYFVKGIMIGSIKG